MPLKLLWFSGKAAENADGPGIGIDQPRRHRAILVQAEFGRSRSRQIAGRLPDRQRLFRQAAARAQVFQPDRVKKFVLPAVFLVR